MTTKRIVYSIFLLHILLCFSWWILHMCLPDNLRLNVVLDSLLYYGMLCTLPIWLYPIGRVIRKSLNHNKLLGVLVIILSSVVVLVGGFIALLVFTFSGPRSVWYKDKTHVITEGYALSKYSFFVYDRGGIVDKVKYKGFTADSPVIPDSAEWKFYDQWGVLMAWSDNKLDKAQDMRLIVFLLSTPYYIIGIKRKSLTYVSRILQRNRIISSKGFFHMEEALFPPIYSDIIRRHG